MFRLVNPGPVNAYLEKYKAANYNKAFVVGESPTSEYYYAARWNVSTVAEAISSAFSSCRQNAPLADCKLWIVNDENVAGLSEEGALRRAGDWAVPTIGHSAMPSDEEAASRSQIRSDAAAAARLAAIQTAQQTEAKAKTSGAAKSRDLTVSWEGVGDLVDASLTYEQDGSSGELYLEMEGGRSCRGMYRWTDRGKGEWSAACDGGLAASGIMRAKDGAFRGAGRDTKGRSIVFVGN